MGLFLELVIVTIMFIASVRYGSKYALFGTVFLGGLLMFISVELAFLLGKSAFCGILLDVGRRAQVPFGRMMTVAVLPAGLVSLMLVVTPLSNPEEMAQELMASSVISESWFQSLYAEGNAQETLQQMFTFWLRLVPGFSFLSTLLSAIMAYALCRRWFLRREIRLPALPPFTSWSIWDHFVWLLILGLGLILWGNEVVATVGWNLVLVMGTLYFFQGLAILRFRFSISRISRFLEALFYLGLVLTLSFSVFLVIGLGVLDIWTSLRKEQPLVRS